MARRQDGADPFELLMLEHRVTPDQDTAEALAGAAAPSTRGAIRRNLQLAEAAPGGPATRELLVEALELAEQVRSRFLRHKVEIEFGKWLERRGEKELAEDLYRRALLDAEVPTGDLLFPFSRIADPALDGLVRVLIYRGRWQEARKVIRRHLRGRLEKTLRSLSSMEDSPQSSDEVSLLVEAAAKPAAWGSQPNTPSSEAWGEPLFADTVRVELWPDGNRVYAWLRGPDQVEEHLILSFSEDVSSLIQRIVGPLYSTGQSLFPPPPVSAIRRLSKELIGPLESHLDHPRLLFIPHKELQVLPFEMLLNQAGKLLLDEFFISYLAPTATPGPAAAGPGLAILPALGAGHGTINREQLLFGTLFGDRNIYGQIEALNDRESDWIHVSSHLSFDPNLWYKSRIGGEGQGIDLWRFLRTRFRSRLLSLSACDVGNSHGWPTPFWVGIAGLLLERNTSAVVLNRWKLDEASAEIYLGFARRVWQGASLDVALTQARRQFRRQIGKRGRVRIDLGHPLLLGWNQLYRKARSRALPEAGADRVDRPAGAPCDPGVRPDQVSDQRPESHVVGAASARRSDRTTEVPPTAWLESQHPVTGPVPASECGCHRPGFCARLCNSHLSFHRWFCWKPRAGRGVRERILPELRERLPAVGRNLGSHKVDPETRSRQGGHAASEKARRHPGGTL